MRRILWAGAAWFLALVMLLSPAALADSGVTVNLNQVQQSGGDLTMHVNLGGDLPEQPKLDQFSIRVDEHDLVPTSMENFDANTQGVHYVFSVDVSETVLPFMDNLRAAMKSFVDGLGPLDTVSIITFGENVKERIVASADHDAIKAAIDGLWANEGMTALYKGVIDAVNIAASTGGRGAVIVVTDGYNQPTADLMAYTEDSIADEVRTAQVPLYSFGVSGWQGVNEESLKNFASMTGGEQYIITSNDFAGRLDRVAELIRGTIVLHADLVNYDGKSSFDDASTFKVGFQTNDGTFAESNVIQQKVNWNTVPAPTAEVTPTPIPSISLELDDTEIAYVSPEQMASISGLITVDQGAVEADALSITVNGEPWTISEMMRNGSNYTFSAQGLIPAGTDSLEIRAEIRDLGIASRIQRVVVVMPEVTPEPVLSVELDEDSRALMYEPGTTVTIGGVINVQGTIDPNDLRMFVNGVAADMAVVRLNDEQYEFSTDVAIQEGSSEELTIKVQLNGIDVSSRAQRLFLVTPAPTAQPEIVLTLNDTQIDYTEGQNVVVEGNIEILSGDVTVEDLALYVNKFRWEMELTPLSDGTYGFRAENTLAGDVTGLDVRVRLQSNTQVASNSEMIVVATPEPSATPVPTQRPEVTPPPTAVPTAGPTPVSSNEEEESEETGIPLPFIIGGVLLVAILVTAIILFVNRGKLSDDRKRRKQAQEMPKTLREDEDSDLDQDGGPVQIDTIMETHPSDEQGATIIDSAPGAGEFFAAGVGYMPEEGKPAVATPDAGETERIDTANLGGTVHADQDEDVGKTQRMDQSTSVVQPAGSEPAKAFPGTERLDPDEEFAGTERLDVDEEIRFIDVTVEESRRNGETRTHTLRLEEDGRPLVFGQTALADVILKDTAVSAEHLKLTFDGENLFVEDLASTNGTKVNGEKLAPHEPARIENGVSVQIGRTRLKFRFGQPETY